MNIKRNPYLDCIQGPRLYAPPPNFLILRMLDNQTSAGGILLGGSNGATAQPSEHDMMAVAQLVAEVVAVGECVGEHWAEGPPADVGHKVLVSCGLGPMYQLHDDLVAATFGCVISAVLQGRDLSSDDGSFYWEPAPDPEKATSLHISDEPDVGGRLTLE